MCRDGKVEDLTKFSKKIDIQKFELDLRWPPNLITTTWLLLNFESKISKTRAFLWEIRYFSGKSAFSGPEESTPKLTVVGQMTHPPQGITLPCLIVREGISIKSIFNTNFRLFCPRWSILTSFLYKLLEKPPFALYYDPPILKKI